MNVYSRAGLQVSTAKTEVLKQLVQPAATRTLQVSGSDLKDVTEFRYLGCMLADGCDLGSEIRSRVSKATSAYGKLTGRVFYNKNLTLYPKVKVYKAICLSILLYGCETWVLYRKHLKVLESFHTRCLKRMIGLKWWHRVPHTDIRRADIKPVECIIAHRQLRWVGHVVRMPEERLPRRVLYGELTNGWRSVGEQRKRYIDHIATTLRKCGIQTDKLEDLAADRCRWRQACYDGVSQYARQYHDRAAERRARRHLPTLGRGNYDCQLCGRSCGSRIVLHSHISAHRRRGNQ